jgi:arsenite methyltransferase
MAVNTTLEFASTMAPETRSRYGIDEPRWPLLGAAAGTALLVAAMWARGRSGRWALLPAAGAVCFLGGAVDYLHTTTRGKFAVWRELLRDLDLRGDETVLDMGCGRGAVLLMAARLVPGGQAIGVDLWRTAEQSGNSPEATRRNAELEGLADRVELRTGDLRAMPVADASIDVVVSSLAIHNVVEAEGRRRALDEAMRALRLGGRLVIADIAHVTHGYAAHLRARGMDAVTVRGLGWRFWYGGPWAATSVVTARKPAGRTERVRL